MKRIAHALTSEPLVLTMIVVNAFALGFGGCRDDASWWAVTARWVDYGCVIFFALELALKVRLLGWRAFWQDNWNRFDFVVVVASSPALLQPVIETQALATLLLLRLGRLARLFRLLRFIPNREHLITGIRRALRASVGVFLALALLDVVLAVGATQLFGRYAEEHFGNPILSSYSLFRVFTVEGWNELPEAIAIHAPASIAILARLYFGLSVLVGGLLGLSLANAVFVDEMTSDNNRHVETKMDALLREVRELRGELAAARDGARKLS